MLFLVVFSLFLFLSFFHFSLMPNSDDSSFLPSIPFRHAYGPKVRSLMVFSGQGRTLQSFKSECDINVIMSRYQQTGIVDHVSKRPAQWGEVPELDFQKAMGLIVEAREKFGALPAEVRDRFANDPARMMAFLNDEANRAEGEKLGLLVPRPAPQEAAGAAAGTPPGSGVASPPANAS